MVNAGRTSVRAADCDNATNKPNPTNKVPLFLGFPPAP